MKSQLNIRVTETQRLQVEFDAAAFHKTKDVIIQAALSELFKLGPQKQIEIYNKFPNKIFGRPAKKNEKRI